MVLTGGSSRRLGQDKATAVVAGKRMVDRVLEQIPPDVPVVVVGPDPQARREVVVTREDPPGGGPAAAIGAGLRAVTTPWVAVIAADMPFAVPVVVGMLDRLAGADAVVPGAEGHRQPLCALYRTRALQGVRIEPGMSMRTLLDGLRVEYVPGEPDSLIDIDTPADLGRAARRLTIMELQQKGTVMQEWVAAVMEALGLDADVDVDLILDVAKDVAHGVQRPAAPVTAYVLGLAVAAGADPGEAAAAVQELADEWPVSATDA